MSLIAHQDNDIFGPSWIAGTLGSQSLSKSFKSHDIEAVNVIKTCDKLRSALMQKSSNQQRGGTHNEKQCAVREPELTFRTCTNLWYGTLKIYEQQVNTLLRQSHDLVLRSSTYDVKSLNSSKRKSSDTSHKMVKKRRLTISHAKESTFLSTNYSDLLDDLERITQDTIENSVNEFKKSSCTRPLAQLQIREFTIREISATTFEDDVDDTGFGEATHEEISQFLNYVEGPTNSDKIKTPTKRKMSYEKEPLVKHRCSHDSTIEPVRNENTSMTNGFLSTPQSFRCSSLERQISPAKTIETFIHPENQSLTETNKENIVSSAILLQQNCLENTIPSDIRNKINDIDVKEEKLYDENLKNLNKVWSPTNKHSKLIIDKCIKIEESEIIDQIKCSPDVKKINKMIFKKLKIKKSVTALELLTRFNRRAFKLTMSFKQKISLKPEQFRRDYLNLLSDILKIDYNEEWASEIYPKWQQYKNPQTQSNFKRSKKTPCKQRNDVMLSTVLNILDENSIKVQIDANNNATDILNDSIAQQDFQENKESLNYTASNEWRPFGVMMKLLDMWRYSIKNEIDAVDFCNSAKQHINKAITFYSLLNLCKNQFIEITKRPQTIQMNKIVLGEATKKLINTNK